MMGTIPYVDRTWNPMVGCSHASPGCDRCYAAPSEWPSDLQVRELAWEVAS